MPEFVYHLSDMAVFLILSGICIFGSMVIICLIHHYIPHELRERENAVIVGVSATISLIYGVLTGLIALYLINSISYASDAVQQEANAAANIYRATQWLETPQREEVRAEIKKYLQNAVDTEWPLMNQGQAPDIKDDDVIEAMSGQLLDYSRQHPGADVIPIMLESIKKLYDSRQMRIQAGTLSLGSEIWSVILIGTFLTVFINFLYGMNFYLHLVMAAAAGLMVGSILFLIVVLDRPFQGEFGLQPDGLQAILHKINAGGSH